MKENKNNSEYVLRRYATRGTISIYIVDGKKIRKELDPEFSNFGQHYRFSYIPENHFWLDREAVLNERHYFIDHLLCEWKLMKNGLSYEKALERADRKERAERQRISLVKKLAERPQAEQLEKTRVRLLGRTRDNLEICLVRGKLVRSLYFIDFTEGGHDLVYSFVPEKEIWIDNDLLASERAYVLLHELNERRLMSKGMNYNQAHSRSSRLEWQARHDKSLLLSSPESLGWKKKCQNRQNKNSNSAYKRK